MTKAELLWEYTTIRKGKLPVSETFESQSQQTRAELERVLHELRVHQIELELQNRELRETQASPACSKQSK